MGGSRNWGMLALVLAACSSATEQAPPQPMPTPSVQQVRRPYLGPVVAPNAFQEAVRAGTRTTSGQPGARYWQNFASYRINARVATDSKKLEGTAAIVGACREWATSDRWTAGHE